MASFSPSTTVSCPCSPFTALNSVVRPTSRSNSRQHFRSGFLIRTRRPQNALNSGSCFLDSLGCRRLIQTAGLPYGSSKRLQRRNAGAARAGLPVVSSIPVLGPVMNAVFNPVVLMIIYLSGASRFWSGFNRTTYTNSTPARLALTALWPALYVASKAYRANFKKAVLY